MSAENRSKLVRGVLAVALVAEGVNYGYSLVTHHDVSHALSKEVMLALAGDPTSDFSGHRITIDSTPTSSVLIFPTASATPTETPFILPTVTLQPTRTKEPTPTPEQLVFCDLSAVKTLQDIKDQCTIPFGKLNLLDSSLQAYSQPFDMSKIKKDVYITDAERFIMYGTGKGYFRNKTERPYRLGLVAYSETTYLDGRGDAHPMDLLVLPIEVPDPNNPHASKWIKGIFTFPSDWESKGQLKYILDLWMKNGPIIIENPYFSGIADDKINLKNPVTEPTFKKHPDMTMRFAETVENDNLDLLTDPDIILEVSVTR